MNHCAKYSLFIICIMLMLSCKKDALMTYEGRNSVYFVRLSSDITTLDSVPVNFGYIPDDITDTTLNISVALMGPLLGKELDYEIEVDPKGTTMLSSEYSLQERYIFPAGKPLSSMQVNIKKPANGTAVVLTLKNKPNSNFQNDLFGFSKDKRKAHAIRFYVNNTLIVPKGWSTSPEGNFFTGVFSKKKLLLLSELTIKETNDNKWTAQLVAESFEYNADIFGDFLNSYLNEMKAKGTPVLEADGSLMTAGAHYNK